MSQTGSHPTDRAVWELDDETEEVVGIRYDTDWY